MAQVGQEHDEIATDLKATLAARRELGPEMDDELVELLLARVDAYIASQVAGQVARRDSGRSERDRSQIVAPGSTPSFRPWRGFVTLALFLIAGSMVFGAHVHAFPPLAAIILLIVFLSTRGCSGNRRSQRL